MGETRNDHKVEFVSEEKITRVATDWRYEAMLLENGEYLVTAKFILSKLIGKYKKAVKILKLTVYEKSFSETRKAYVSFYNFSLNVRKDIWENALLGLPEENHILAHELGHMILHDHHAQAFSINPKYQINFVPNEESAEWQANTFASHLLLPEVGIKLNLSASALETLYGIPESIAAARLNENIEKRKRAGSLVFAGQQCPACDCYEVIHEGNELVCIKCQPPLAFCSE